jgi:Icc protein
VKYSFDNGGSVHLIQITDCHIHNEKHMLLSGVNTFDSLNQVLDGLNSSAEPVDLVVVTGDLTHEGDARAYQSLLEQLEKLPAPYFWLAGNHDHLQFMLEVGTNERLRTKQIILPHWQILMLDSHIEDEVPGDVSQSELSWLATALREHPDKYAAIFVHHHVVPVKCAWLDTQLIANAEQLLTLFANTPQLKFVCSGHVHQEFAQQQGHFSLLTTPSTCVQFKTVSDDYAEDELAPGYRRFALHPDGSFDTQVIRVGELVRVPGTQRGYPGF